jgi:hypothetical protein
MVINTSSSVAAALVGAAMVVSLVGCSSSGTTTSSIATSSAGTATASSSATNSSGTTTAGQPVSPSTQPQVTSPAPQAPATQAHGSAGGIDVTITAEDPNTVRPGGTPMRFSVTLVNTTATGFAKVGMVVSLGYCSCRATETAMRVFDQAKRPRDSEVPLRYWSPMWTGSVPAARYPTSKPTPVATVARRVWPGRGPQHTRRRRRHRCRCLARR